MKLLSCAVAGAAVLSVTTAGVSIADTSPTVRVSVSSSGGQAEPTPAQLKEPGVHRMNSAEISLSANGRFAVFTSNAVNLVPDDTNKVSDVFVRDLTAGVTTRVNVSDSGAQSSSSYSGRPSISADGRYVVFTSLADNLVPGDTNERSDVFVRDTVAKTTVRASVSATGAQDSGFSSDGVISANGRFVAYVTSGSDLVDDNGPSENVVVKDLATGTLTRASVPLLGGPLVEDGYGVQDLAISADGRTVAFITKASNLVAGDTNDTYDVFVRDMATRITTRVNVPDTNGQANDSSQSLAMTPDGRYVTYDSLASNLVPGDTNGREDVFVRDLKAGTTRLVDTEGYEGNAKSPSISADGSRVSFLMIAPSPSYRADVFVRDLGKNRTTKVTGDGNNDSLEPSISGDGAYLGFSSYASNLVVGDTNDHKDVFVRKLD